MGLLEIAEVDAARWSDFAQLFDAPGGPKSSWCMVWRRYEGASRESSARREEMRSRVARGVPIGLLGYYAGVPVAWCSIAPRDTYRALGGPSFDASPDQVWSLVCLFIQRQYRRQGLSAALIEAAVGHAKAKGATIVEAYPVEPDSPSYRFMGFLDAFLSLGFVEVGRAGQRRHVVRRAV